MALEDKDGNVRRLAASALGKIKDRRAVDPFITLLAKEEKPQVHQYAIKALGRIRDVRARPILEKIASDDAEREYTRAAAQRALKRLSRSSSLVAPAHPSGMSNRLESIDLHPGPQLQKNASRARAKQANGARTVPAPI